ncbi:MAG: 2-oxoacid:ferredoxin oxidoreductase subunit beta [Bacteroidales bacterium]|jgi:2-oxoglutarate ferredoxin oxidoreductase subunit beta|nr:2-oxoacid:ferredoxin oxidoreductase subunit beta [Bacteroidales bacterium]
MSYTQADFKSDQPLKFCAGCGDHAVAASMQKAMAELGIAPDQTAVISGIGCSSRMPYYMNTYGMHTIHGRGLAVATGLKTSRPDLTVWNVSGDGDCLAIGGNHFIHAMRRNIDLNIILFNNKIYGLTKGQYSPTSDRGLVSKSSPWGTVEDPFCPAELCLGARGNFFARAIDADIKNSVEVMKAAAKHKGASVVEMLCNCVIFADGIHKLVTDSAVRADKTILLEDGKPMIYGKNRDKGLILDGWDIKPVTIGENGITEKDLLVHDAKKADPTFHLKLAMMGYSPYGYAGADDDLPIALGVIRDVEAPTYDWAVNDQIEDVKGKKKQRTLRDLLLSGDTWEVK